MDQEIIGADQDDSHVVELLAILVGNNVSSSAEKYFDILLSIFFQSISPSCVCPKNNPILPDHSTDGCPGFCHLLIVSDEILEVFFFNSPLAA